eukprot:scaffold5919_cov121-Skeletonema_menzelii.AAC.2
MTKAHYDLVKRTETTPRSVTKPDNFTPHPEDYAKESDKPSAIEIEVEVDTAEQILEQVLRTAKTESQKQKIRADWINKRLGPQLERLRNGVVKNLNSLREGRRQPADEASTNSVIQWATEQCTVAIKHKGYVYYMKISYDHKGDPKGDEPTNKVTGTTSHSIPIAVREGDQARKLRPEEIGRIGDKPLPGQLIQVSWELFGYDHSDHAAYMKETIATVIGMSHFSNPDEAQRCVNTNYTAIPRPGQEKFFHSLAALIIVPIADFGPNDGNLVYTQRGIGDLTGLPDQTGNVVNELIEDLERQEAKKRNRATRAAEAAQQRIGQFIQFSSHSNHSAHSNDGDLTSVAHQNADVPSVARQSEPPSSSNTNYVTQTSDNNSQSSESSSSPQSSTDHQYDLSDDEDDFDEDSEDVTYLHALIMYKTEFGQEIEEGYGVFFVRSDDIAEGSLYCPFFLRWFNYHVGIRDEDKRSRLHRDLTDRELALLKSEGIDILDENYRRRVARAANEKTVQLVKQKHQKTGGRRKRRRRKDA